MNPRSYHPVIQGSMLVAAADTTAADYPGDNRCLQVPLLPAAAGRPGRNQASQGSPRVRGG